MADRRTFQSCWLYARPVEVHGSPRLYAKLVKKAFYKYRRRAPGVLRLYLASLIHFPCRNAFHISELLNVLSDYGYGSSREAKADTLRKLRSAADFFTELPGQYFQFTSHRKLTRRIGKNNEFTEIDETILHKSNALDFVDLLITIQSSGQTTAAENICNQTGYGRSRVFQAFKNTKLKRYKIYHPVPGMIYTRRLEAITAARVNFWDKGIIADVIKEGDFYKVMLILGLTFDNLGDTISDGGATPETDVERIVRISRVVPAEFKTRTTTVFNATIKKITGVNAINDKFVQYIRAEFIDIDAGDRFLLRHNTDIEGKQAC